MATYALIAAAGQGTRVPGEVPKQYRALAGKPMLWHSIAAVNSPSIDTVFVVLAPGDRRFAALDWTAFAGRLEPLYCGGESRKDSVCNGLIAASAAVDADDWVLVHDAARPCLPRADLERLMSECARDRIGGILALPISDTVKRAGKDEAGAQRIVSTEHRDQLWLAQTPQMFRAGLLTQALREAKGSVTDEASAMEQLGLKPRLVLGSRRNLKVTYPEDFAVAEALLGR